MYYFKVYIVISKLATIDHNEKDGGCTFHQNTLRSQGRRLISSLYKNFSLGDFVSSLFSHLFLMLAAHSSFFICISCFLFHYGKFC